MPKVRSNSSSTQPVSDFKQVKATRRGRRPTSSEQILSTRDSRSRAYHFYQQCRWDQWFDEFAQARLPNGALRYQSALEFAKAKGKTDEQRRWIFAAIGPQPELNKGQRPEVPWLGDWWKNRRTGFGLSSDKADSLERVLKERVGALELARVASGFSLAWLRRVEAMIEQLENFFGGQILLPHLSVKENQARFTFYTKMMSQLHDMMSRASNDFLASNGVHRDNITVLARLEATRVLAGSQPEDAEIQKIRLKPGVTAELINNLSLDDILMTHMIASKATKWSIILPDFAVSTDEQPSCNEFITTFPVERFSGLKVLLTACFRGSYHAYMLENELKQFAKNHNVDTVAEVWRQLEDFNARVSGQVLSTFQKVFVERFGMCAPRDAGTWTNFCRGFRQVARQHHGDALRADPVTKQLVDKYVGFFLKPAEVSP
ncbi:MAG: hypothetical protein M3O09_03470 [Acidobacteriota bacterium]|nr:hypothetical protein [Acidobacteriota bacterium]